MEMHRVAIDIDAPVVTHELQKFMRKKLDEVPGEPFQTRHVTIYRLPIFFHEINKDLCEPRVVSIGPYHHGKEGLHAMEEHKWSTLRDFLARNENVRFEVYINEMRLLEAQARACYSENGNLVSDDFVMMLLLDTCFVLEFFFKIQSEQFDAFLDASWNRYGIFSDLCLLENQIPFFVIHKVFAIQGRCAENCEGPFCPLVDLICDMTSDLLNMLLRFRRPTTVSCRKIDHLLHLIYFGVVPNNDVRREQRDFVTGKSHHWALQFFSCSKTFQKSGSSNSTEGSTSTSIPCTSELQAAGVKFKRKISPCDMFDVSFQNGTLYMPHLELYDISKTILWNMGALEQSQPFRYAEPIVTSFSALMNSLIYTEKDVAILVRSGILENFLQSDEMMASFFNQFGQDFALDFSKHYFYDVFKNLKTYSESTWHKSRARLMQDYFGNPWSSISVIAATILLALTFIQTYYSAAK